MLLVAGSAVAEVVAGYDPGLLEQPDRPVDGGDGDVRVDGVRPAMQLPTSGWSCASESTRAMIRRCSVIRMPFSMQSFSIRSGTCTLSAPPLASK
jgi:hypothetical protein